MFVRCESTSFSCNIYRINESRGRTKDELKHSAKSVKKASYITGMLQGGNESKPMTPYDYNCKAFHLENMIKCSVSETTKIPKRSNNAKISTAKRCPTTDKRKLSNESRPAFITTSACLMEQNELNKCSQTVSPHIWGIPITNI